MSFDKNLRLKRTEKGLTQLELAEKIGATQAAIAQFERGARQPSVGTAQMIAEALDCTLSELLK